MTKSSSKYKQIAHDLLKKIQNNTYPINAVIPREIDLAEIYQVSRPTIRQAIQSLVDLGLLEKNKHSGTVVKSKHIKQQFMQVIENYNQEIDQHGLIPKTNVLSFSKIKADSKITNELQIKKDSEVFKLIRLRFANDNPIVVVTTYLPQKLVPALSGDDFNQVSLYERLQANNQAVVRVRRLLEIKRADETIANLLNIAKNDPIFYFHTWGFNKQKQVVEYSLASYRSDINSFVIDIDQKMELDDYK